MAPSPWNTKHWRLTAVQTLTTGTRSRPGPWIVNVHPVGSHSCRTHRPVGIAAERLDLALEKQGAGARDLLPAPAWRLPPPFQFGRGGQAPPAALRRGGAAWCCWPSRGASWAGSPPGRPTLISRWGTDQASSVHLLTQPQGTRVKIKIALRSCERIRN